LNIVVPTKRIFVFKVKGPPQFRSGRSKGGVGFTNMKYIVSSGIIAGNCFRIYYLHKFTNFTL